MALQNFRRIGRTMTTTPICLLASVLITLPAPLWASGMVYTPVNPSFGGNPNNGSVLMQSAENQNRLTDPNATSTSYRTTPLEDFKTSLQRQVLSRISQKLLQEAFGTDASLAEGGTLTTDDYTLEIDNSGSSAIIVNITQPGQSGVTTITIPKGM